MSGFTFIDLFAGIGGTRLGLEAAGGECAFSSEWDAYAQKTYLANHGDIPRGDIKEVGLDEIPPHDVLVAGFPCQPFSIAGVTKLTALGRANGFANKDQGQLFFDVHRIVDHHRPRAFLLENVKHLRGHDHGNTYRVIRQSLEALGYVVEDEVIDAAAVVPQHRERIYIVGFRDAADARRFEFPRIPDRDTALADILEDSADVRYTLSDRLWSYLQDYARKHRARGNGFGYGLADPRGVTRTLSARYYKDGSEILVPQDGANPRRLTPRECARLMGFPGNFVIPVSDTRAYQQFGNSVVVPVVQAVARKMARTMGLGTPKVDILSRWKPAQPVRQTPPVSSAPKGLAAAS